MAARKKNAPRMTEDDKRAIYQVLKRNFDFDEEYPLANLGWCFLREDIDKADYGFIKLTPMLEEMADFVTMSTKEVGGVSQSMFSLRENNDYEQKSKRNNESKNQKDRKQNNDTKNLKDTKSESESNDSGFEGRERAEKPEKQTAKQASASKAESKQGSTSHAESQRALESKAKFEVEAQQPASPMAEGARQPSDSKTESGQSAGFKVNSQASDAKADSKKATDKKSAPSAKKGQKASSTEADSAKTAKPSARPSRSLRGRTIPGKALERFADLGTWSDFLSTLASLALEEPWDFCEVPGIQAVGGSTKRYDILHNYIRYTFYRLTLEDKVAFSDDEGFAAFNTGLVDKHYEDIYACFEPSSADGRQPWAFVGFCTAGTGKFGKRLVREMNPLPQPASYLQRKEDLLFDLDREVVCDIRHIVVDNVHRLPLNFLRDELASSAECRGILAGVEDLTPRGRAARFDRLRAAIANDPRLFTRLSNSINAAIDQARRQVRWNYKTAVPAYYPRTNSMNLLLPLNLTEDTTPDVALVVELQKSGNYQGQTIVTMAQAYRDARLLCRPYIDWLSPASIIDAAGEDDEEE